MRTGTATNNEMGSGIEGHCRLGGEMRVIAVAVALVGFFMTESVIAGGPTVSKADPRDGLDSLDGASRDGELDRTVSPVSVCSRLSSPFGMRRARLSKRPQFHAGVDFRAARGEEVFAVRAGVVELVGRDEDRGRGLSGYGNAVVIYHADEDRWTLYAHLATVEVELGQVVAAGEHVGTVGATSNGRFQGMGAHLHFEVRERDRSGASPFPGRYRVNNIDPRRWLASRGVDYDRRGDLVVPSHSIAHATAILVERPVE